MLGPDSVPGFERLPEWVQTGMEPDPKLRDHADVELEYVSGGKKPAISAAKRLDETVREQGLQDRVEGKGRGKTLDDWLDESESEEEESEDEETEEDMESEEGSSEESEEESQRTLIS